MKKILVSLVAAAIITMPAAPVFAAFGKTDTKAQKEEVSTNPSLVKDETLVTELSTVPEGTEQSPSKKEAGLSSLSAEQILSLTPKSFEELTGKKMSFKEKIVLKYVQRNMKNDLKKEGKIDIKKYFEEGDRRFNIGGFLLGLLLGLIGVALAHIFSNDKSFRRSSWYGVGVLLIVAIIVAAAGGGN